eukprot:TRINITY_DN35845_c0_g1_i2.p1 TRINITY_DN35845_c0_g1~~TRINITY_DN35845_c0_g1_i2.p1  ORF type:complete len:378 (+),score=103.66 TRINITY_DN35845_c0_g1_i2:50-1183(+)
MGCAGCKCIEVPRVIGAARYQSVQLSRVLVKTMAKEEPRVNIDEGEAEEMMVLPPELSEEAYEGLERSDPSAVRHHKSMMLADCTDPTERRALEEDTYGASLFSLVEDLHILCGNKGDEEVPPVYMTVLRLVFVHVVLIFNYLLQFGMLQFIKEYVVVKQVEQFYHEEELAREAMKEGKEIHLEKLLITEHPLFVMCVLCLWTLTALIELRKLENFVKTIQSLVTVQGVDHMIFPWKDDRNQDQWDIKGLTPGIRVVVYTVIVLPKLLIVILLFALGFMWLSATPNATDLILNCLSLTFVVEIDEALYSALVPACLKEKMRRVHLTAHVDPGLKTEHHQVMAGEKASFLRSMFYFVMPVMMSYGYIYYNERMSGAAG